MVLYNLTVVVDYDHADRWLRWMKEKHMPDVLATGVFLEGKIARILAEEQGGVSYSIQYLAADMESYNRYEREFAPALRKEHEDMFPGQVAAFRTLLDIIHHEGHEKG